jgi:HSP90 family molecular chaperone
VNAPEGQPSAQMIRMYKAMGQELPSSKKTLIINPDNALVKKYISEYESDPKNTKVSLFVHHIYEQALLLE